MLERSSVMVLYIQNWRRKSAGVQSSGEIVVGSSLLWRWSVREKLNFNRLMKLEEEISTSPSIIIYL